MRRPYASALLLALLPATAAPAPLVPGLAELRRREARFAPVELRVDLSSLPASERAALAKLVEASRIMDALFLRQEWAGNQALLAELATDDSPLGRARLETFLRFKGPWDRLLHDAPFLPGVGPKPPQGNHYAAGATREEIERWLASLPEAERAVAGGFFTTVRRDAAGRLTAVPYAVEYQGELAHAAALLREAAALTADAGLRDFLGKRAAAFLSNDYYDSDVAWMKLGGAVEPTIGPYETYGDGWFGAKASFQAFVCLRDDAETRRLARLSGELQAIENALPMDDRLKNPKIGALAPIRVVNQLFGAGDAMQGVQTAAFNLPNDERIVREQGTKRVMLKNVQEAKFEMVLRPVARAALSPGDRARLSFEAFFQHILLHELVHGLGPHELQRDGRAITVREALADLDATVEEAKADVVGLFAVELLVDRGVLDAGLRRSLYPTYLASAFRSIRFGLNEAHGKGTALQLNWLLDAGAVTVRPDGTFAIDAVRARAAIEGLAREILSIQARGDATAAKSLLDRLGTVRPEVKRVLDRLEQVPVDIAPRFVTAEKFLPR